MKKYRYTRDELVKLLEDQLDVFIADRGCDSPSGYMKGTIESYQYVLLHLKERLPE